MATTTETPQRFEERVPAWLHRHRHVAGPPAVGALAYAVATGGHLLGDWPQSSGWRWLVTIVVVAALVLGLEAATGLPSKREQQIGVAGWLAGAGWVLAGTWWSAPWTAVMTAVGAPVLVGLWAAWWSHRRVRRGVSVDRSIEAWGDGSAIGLPGTTVRGTKAGAGSFSYRVSAREVGRYVIDDYTAKRKRIAARFKVRAEAVSFRELAEEGEVEVTIREGAREVIAVDVDDDGPIDVAGPHRVGATDDGRPLTIAFYLVGGDGGRAGAQHGAGTGDSGAGKSSLVNRQARIVARARDAVLWIADLSMGAQELKAWAPVCDWFATTPDEVERMILAANALSEDRGHRANQRLFVPSVAEPLPVMLFDEAATIFAPELLPADAERADRVAARRSAAATAAAYTEGVRNYRKHGVSAWAFTQYGDAAALASAAAKQQLISGHAAVFYGAKNTTGHLVIPAGAGARCAELPANKPGTLFLKSTTMDGIVKGRVEYMDDAAVAATVERWTGQQPEIEAAGRTAMGEAYARRQRTADGSPPPAPAPELRVPSFARAAPKRMRSAEESRAQVLAAVAGFGADGARPMEVVAASGRDKAIVLARLGELEKAGRVTRRAGRLYAADEVSEGGR